MPTKSTSSRSTKRQPRRHPGVIIGEIVTDDMGLSVVDTARQVGCSRQLLHEIFAGRARVTLNMAEKLGELVGNGPDLWVRMQTEYDLQQARQRTTAACGAGWDAQALFDHRMFNGG
jgi:addiction module HigA family antidote